MDSIWPPDQKEQRGLDNLWSHSSVIEIESMSLCVWIFRSKIS